ncbi:MAG TPA: AMP-binding protein [Syntrophales bacterium]|nr:AMP-binding protein [Syntrophales bacterium]
MTNQDQGKMSYLKFEPAWGTEPLPPIPDVPFFELLRRSAYLHPMKTALISLGKEVSYHDLNEMADRFAAALADLGVKKGDRVGVLLPNSAQHVIAFQGIIRAGAISVPCNVMLKSEELIYILNDAGVETVVCIDLLCPIVQMVQEKTKIKTLIAVHCRDISAADGWIPPLLMGEKKTVPNTLDFAAILEKYPPQPPDVTIDPQEDLALMIYTAGTTGVPKGVMETHANMVFTCVNHAHTYGIDYNDMNLQILPMFHVGGYYLMLHPILYKGGTAIMMPMFDPAEFLKAIDRYKANLLVGPPTLYVALVNHPDITRYDLKHFKSAVAAAAPVPIPLQERWKEITGIELNKGWGMTETNGGQIVSLPNKRNLDSIGVPMSGEVKIVHKDSGEIVPRGEFGEIMIRSPQIAKGYWNKPEETEKTFEADGWLHTGDGGYISEDGFVYFVERIKELIIASGYNISPSEVESVIMKHSAVVEAAVIGIPHEYRGETVKAFVVLKDEAKGKVTADEIIEFCKQSMATYKKPEIVAFIDALPKNSVGKVLRRVLRDQEAGHDAA